MQIKLSNYDITASRLFSVHCHGDATVTGEMAATAEMKDGISASGWRRALRSVRTASFLLDFHISSTEKISGTMKSHADLLLHCGQEGSRPINQVNLIPPSPLKQLGNFHTQMAEQVFGHLFVKLDSLLGSAKCDTKFHLC